MIILIIDQNSILAFEYKGQPPISTNVDRPMSFKLTFQLMETPAGSTHIFRATRVVESEKLATKPFRVFGLNARLRTRSKEPFDSFVPKRLYHLLLLYSMAIQTVKFSADRLDHFLYGLR